MHVLIAYLMGIPHHGFFILLQLLLQPLCARPRSLPSEARHECESLAHKYEHNKVTSHWDQATGISSDKSVQSTTDSEHDPLVIVSSLFDDFVTHIQ